MSLGSSLTGPSESAVWLEDRGNVKLSSRPYNVFPRSVVLLCFMEVPLNTPKALAVFRCFVTLFVEG